MAVAIRRELRCYHYILCIMSGENITTLPGTTNTTHSHTQTHTPHTLKHTQRHRQRTQSENKHVNWPKKGTRQKGRVGNKVKLVFIRSSWGTFTFSPLGAVPTGRQVRDCAEGHRPGQPGQTQDDHKGSQAFTICAAAVATAGCHHICCGSGHGLWPWPSRAELSCAVVVLCCAVPRCPGNWLSLDQ